LDEVLPLIAAQDQRKQAVLPGTVLTREWNGQLYRVMVVDGGFAACFSKSGTSISAIRGQGFQ
jgi:hypothetical protein